MKGYWQQCLSALWLALNIVMLWVAIAEAWPMLHCIALVFLFHAQHELLHSSLLPRKYRAASHLLGTLVSGMLLHNYAIVRASHLTHHRCGRKDSRVCLLDHRDHPPSCNTYLAYYLNLFGKNYLDYIPAGIICLASERMFERLYFRMRLPSRRHIGVSQVAALVGMLLMVAVSPSLPSLLAGFAAFMVYWGFSQNVSHYGLNIGGPLAVFGSRTYTVNRLAHFLFFGSIFRHLEHHTLPHVPGVLLNASEITDQVQARVGPVLSRRDGLTAYIRDLIYQLRGPNPPLEEWRASRHKIAFA